MKTQSLRSVYLIGILLATGLFAVHTMILFETAYVITSLAEPAKTEFGVHVAGPALILAAFMILFMTHFLEAAAWAVFFWKRNLIESFGKAIYFTGTSLTALGYGDVVLVPPWRGLGPIMATNGILMFGCSTAFLFFAIQRVWKFL
jgi:hypothetical protein